MAIRLQLPPFAFARLRVRWFVARSHYERQKRAVNALIQGQVTDNPAWWQAGASRILLGFSVRLRLRQARARREEQTLRAFEEHYEDLVDLLCWAAKDCDHPTTEQEARYGELRVRVRLHYRSLRSRLRPFWQDNSANSNEPEQTDPFEALFLPDSLDEVIYSSNSVEAIMQTRYALDACHEDLEARINR